MTPHYQALLVRMYNDWLAKNRKPGEIAQLRTMAGVAAGAPVPFMRGGDHSDAPRLRLDAELPLRQMVAHRRDIERVLARSDLYEAKPPGRVGIRSIRPARQLDDDIGKSLASAGIDDGAANLALQLRQGWCETQEQAAHGQPNFAHAT